MECKVDGNCLILFVSFDMVLVLSFVQQCFPNVADLSFEIICGGSSANNFCVDGYFLDLHITY